MEIITTSTILNSFIRKYSGVADINADLMRRLFKFKIVVIDYPININGCVIKFTYTFHNIPAIGFEVNNQNKSIYFSGDTFFSPVFYKHKN